jgi:hypothetical protein
MEGLPYGFEVCLRSRSDELAATTSVVDVLLSATFSTFFVLLVEPHEGISKALSE